MFKFNIGEKVTFNNDTYIIKKVKNLLYELEDLDGFAYNGKCMFHDLTNQRKELYMKETNKMGCDQQEMKRIIEKYLNIKEFEYGSPCAKHVYKHMFKEPIKRIFEWEEEAWQGTIYVLYEYVRKSKTYFIEIYGHFGSCGGCDPFMDADNEQYKERIMKALKTECNIYTSLSNIPIRKYIHPELKQKLLQFKY